MGVYEIASSEFGELNGPGTYKQDRFGDGSTGGVGLAIAQSLAAEGSHVYVNGRTQPRAAAAVAATRLRTATASVKGIVADLSSAAGAEAVTASLPAADVLVNNVAIFDMKPFAFLVPRSQVQISQGHY